MQTNRLRLCREAFREEDVKNLGELPTRWLALKSPVGAGEISLGRKPQDEDAQNHPSPGGAADCSASVFSTVEASFSVAPPGLRSSLIARFPGLTPRAILYRRSAALRFEKPSWTRVIQHPTSNIEYPISVHLN